MECKNASFFKKFADRSWIDSGLAVSAESGWRQLESPMDWRGK